MVAPNGIWFYGIGICKLDSNLFSMKNILLSLIALPFLLSAQTGTLEISPATSFMVVYSQKEGSRVQIKNRSKANLKIEVQNRFNEAYVSGFGLAPFGNVELNIKASELIRLENVDKVLAKVKVNRLGPRQIQKALASENFISFSLINSGEQSIPLEIPGVMNPNLSPNSESSVRLKIGQKIYFKKGLKRVLLYTVDETLEENTPFDIYKLLQSKSLVR